MVSAAKTNIYILKLVGGNYYIGKSSDVAARVQEHFDGTGSAWTVRYRPLAVERIIEGADSFDEDSWVKRYMSQKGIDKVRGGSYSSLELDPMQIATLNHELNGAKDKCFNCGSTGHFASACSKQAIKSAPRSAHKPAPAKCYRCGREGHYADNCYATTHVSDTHKCYRCGREGHYADNCYAKTRVYYDSSSDDSWDD